MYSLDYHIHLFILNYAYINIIIPEPVEMRRRSNLEQKALQSIISNGRDGVLQSQLWRKLAATSREGSRIALKLEEKGLIVREKELFNGRWTYRLYPKRLPATIDLIENCPCLMCPENQRCGSSYSISPKTCNDLTEWLLSLVEDTAGEFGDS